MIPHNKPTIGPEEEEAVTRVLRSGNLANGTEVSLFEKEFSDYMGLKKEHSVAVSNGTSALFLSLWALDANSKKIAFPSYVCSALRHAVGMINGVETIIDSSKNSPNINQYEMKNNSHDIEIVPHMYGIPTKITRNENIPLIEDCCQALGARVNEELVGLQGTTGIFSFFATKVITSGGHGGMIISKEKEIIEKIKDYREFDGRKDQKSRFNFQMTELQAAVGREQLKKLPAFLERREEIFQMYRSAGLELLDVNKEDQKSIKPIRYRAILKTSNQREIITKLDKKEIKAIVPLEDWELLGEKESSPNSLEFSKNTVSIPIYPSLKDEEVELIIKTIQD